jgi:hypothetical protein
VQQATRLRGPKTFVVFIRVFDERLVGRHARHVGLFHKLGGGLDDGQFVVVLLAHGVVS